MQVLIFVIVSLISAIVSSTKCKNPELKCIEFCCGKTQFYYSLHQSCYEIPDEFKASLLALLHDNTTVSEAMEFVEYGECDNSIIRQSYISSCFSSYLNKTSNQVYFQELTDVPCNRVLQPAPLHVKVIVIICYFSLPICLPIMIVYTCGEASKEQLTFKLISWYLVSMTAYFGVVFVCWLHASVSDILEEDVEEIYQSVAAFLFMTTYLWQNVIGFQIWSGFKRANLQNNSAKDQRHFVYYSVFVWGISAIITSTHFLLSRMHWFYKVVDYMAIAIPCFNMLTFCILSLNISITRCKVINLTQEDHFKRKLTIIILRLGLVMGIPRMIIVTLSVFFQVYPYLGGIFIVLEPYSVFTVLVWKPKSCFRCNYGCGCCRKSEEMSNVAEVDYVNTNRD